MMNDKISEKVPSFDGTDYDDYKRKVIIWDTMGSLIDEKKRPAHLFQGLPKNTLHISFQRMDEIKIAMTSNDPLGVEGMSHGVAKFMEIMDHHYEKDKTDQEIMDIQAFMRIKRVESDINKFLTR